MSGIDGAIGWWRPPAPTPTPAPTLPQYALIGTFNGKSVVVGASQRFGGAIYTIKVDGFEFLDSSDHGRELQTAWQYGTTGEANNPTEAGSAANGAGSTSTSQILSISSSGTVLKSRTHPAYWYAYGGQAVTPDFLEKTVTLSGNVLTHEIGIYIADPYRTSMAVEGLTAYLPQTFSRLFTLDGSVTTEVNPTSLLPTDKSVIAATADLSHALCLSGQNTHWVGKIGPWPKLDASWFSASNPSGWYRWTTRTIFGTFQEVIGSAAAP